MANQSNLPTFSFGNTGSAPASSTGSDSSAAPKPLFGNTSSNLFGNSTSTTAQANPTTTASTNPFGGLGTTSGSQGTSLFGTSTGQTNSLFGGGSQKQPTSFFGSGNKPASTGFTFGKQPEQSNTQTSGTTSSPFPSLATPAKMTATGDMSNSFAKSSAPAGSTTPSTTGIGGGFSLASTTPAGPPPQSGPGGSNLFGASKKPTSNLFGGASTGASEPSLFSSQPGDAGTAKTTAPSGSNLFGMAPVQGGQGIFGNAGGSQPPANPFGNLGKPAASTQATSPGALTAPSGPPPGPKQFSFGTPSTSSSQPASSTAASQPTSNLFGATPTSSAATSQPTSNLFGTAPTPSAATSQPGSNLFGAPTSTSSAPEASKAAAAGGLFSNLKTSAAPSSGSPFSLGTTAATSAGTSAATTSTSQPATTSASTLFGGLGASTTAGSAPATTTAAAGFSTTSTAGLGASTTGPAPSAQSRLKNKTMDEIITRWASDLTKYQKEFQSQAESVSTWDRMLVENSEKIQKLYGRTLEAERATAEVEKQLSAVESQQNELGYWLDMYEKEVDEMMSRQLGQGEALQGPDQERERTYAY
jgi:nuclear pore complex protein Nup62